MQIQYLRLLIMVYYILCIFIKTFTIIIVKINQEWSRWEKKLGISNREISGEFKEQPMIDYQYVDNVINEMRRKSLLVLKNRVSEI